jgi:uncharacterized membrane protein
MLSFLRRFEARKIDAPRRTQRFAAHYDPDAFGRVSETIARFFGTARYLVIQTIIVVIWIGLNVFAISAQWDPYPFILLNLVFSTQAAYAAPLILLAQNRQAERDRIDTDEDRKRNARALADNEFLARELMAARISLGRIESTLARLEEERERERREREEAEEVAGQ